MRDFACGGDRSIYRFVRFHIMSLICSAWQYLMLAALALGFILRLLFWPLRKHWDGHRHHAKASVQSYCLKYTVVDINIRNSYNLQAAVPSKRPSVVALAAHKTNVALYFLLWKPVLCTLYILSTLALASAAAIPDITAAAMAGIVIGYIAFLIVLAIVHDWITGVVLVPIFRYVQVEDSATDLGLPTTSNPTVDHSMTNYTRLPSATDVEDRELYCIAVPAPPFVSTFMNQHPPPLSMTSVSRDSSNDSVTKQKPPRYSLPLAQESSENDNRSRTTNSFSNYPVAGPLNASRLGSLLDPLTITPQTRLSSSSRSSPQYSSPPKYSSLPTERSQDSATSSSTQSVQIQAYDASSAAESTSIVDAPDKRIKVTVPTNITREYDAFEYADYEDIQPPSPHAVPDGVYRSALSPTSTLPHPQHATSPPEPESTWLSPTNYASVASVYSPSSPAYGLLSPQGAAAPPRQDKPPSRPEFHPPQVFRSVDDIGLDKQDAVHFVAYAPPSVALHSTFLFSIWAFLVHQRHDVHEQATAGDSKSRQLSREMLLPVRRGALAHVQLQVPDGFVVEGDGPTQAFTWTGDVTSIPFSVTCLACPSSSQVLFKATIVVGAHVMVVKSFVFVHTTTTPRLVVDDDDDDGIMHELTTELERLPTTFDEIPYDLLDFKQLVGEGHFGDAYRAVYNGRDVVVKTFKAQDFGTSTDQLVHEFRHEAAVLNMFGHHPNIVPFVGASTDPSQPLALVTAYLPHGSLESQWLRGPTSTSTTSSTRTSTLSVPQKQVILADASAGLLNIHEGGFVHRDIAARNCLVDDAMRVKLCDFGMSRRVNAVVGGSHVSTGVGPLKYMAPESLVPPHSFSYGSDVYSYGVLMWETFAEASPFADLSGPQAAAYVLEGGRLNMSTRREDGSSIIPAKYQTIMAACFAEDPSKRPTMTQLHRAFTTW
ncbi:hypothetical protein DYB26_011017 [Aphanomyces astaci]|uniref:Protein kinase domain-containing protein n=1 Tax=Aphanomyces astaci TaxID=112090 RepID=A0A397EPE8_APHAT|nr:hypothetical protein DYB38_012594 [Aphanomyces astaci]RHZ01394.1 hypothetical protein DYB31_008233 [Aphanomyces astaci]RHZ05974.1 hypothetical protein DYB26_011017 [Aphanomyces astaci]